VLESEFSVAAVRVLSPLSPLCWPERLRALPFADSREAVVGAGAQVLKQAAAGTKVAAAAVTMAAAAAAATAASASAKVGAAACPRRPGSMKTTPPPYWVTCWTVMLVADSTGGSRMDAGR